MRRQILIVLTLAFLGTHVCGQRRPHTSALYIELVGNAIGISFNYEYVIPHWAFRLGIGGHSCLCDYEVIPPYDSTGTYHEYDFPETSTGMLILMANYLMGGGPHYGEFGAGILYALGDPRAIEGKKDRPIIPTATLGYQYFDPKDRFVFRIGLTPVFVPKDMLMSFGLSVGVGF